MIETSQLQTLVAISNEGSFSLAAEKLGVTQSAISQSVKSLEKKLAVKLLRKNGKKIVLTPEGENLFRLSSRFLVDLNTTITNIQNAKNDMTGIVRVGTLSGIGKSWLAPELLDFSLQHEKFSVSIVLGFQDDLIRDFNENNLDILVLPEEALPNTGERLFLAEEKSTFIFPKNRSFEINKEMTLEEISNLPTILFEQNDPLYFQWCRKHFNTIPKEIHVKYVVNSHGNMLQAVSKGLGVAVVPNHVLNRTHLIDELEYFDQEFEISNGNFYLLYHKDSFEIKRIQKTIEYLLSIDNPLNRPLKY